MSLNKIKFAQTDFTEGTDYLAPDGNGSALTDLNASEITSGTLDSGVLDTDVTVQGNTFNGASQLVQLNSSSQYPALDGSLITGVVANIPRGTCSTASATNAKEVTLSGFTLATGATIEVTFTNANTATAPTLNVNSTGAISIASESGTVTSSTNPFYVPASVTVEFTYNGTYWIYKNRVVTNYVNGTSWYRVYSDGWVEQGGIVQAGSVPQTINLLKYFSNTNYSTLTAQIWSVGAAGGNYNAFIMPTNKTTSSFRISGNSITSIYFIWEAKGY